MGANAQTTVPTFTTSQVLTAAQMNESARTGVPVFAGTAERDAAFGGTGEKTLAEGQLCYLESTNVVQYYDGATWATVGPSSPGGLVRVGGTAFSAVASVSYDNVFTSTYENYLIVGYATGTSPAITMRMRASGTDNSSSNYVFVRANIQETTGSWGFTVSNGAQTSWNLGTTNSMQFSLTMFAPQATRATAFEGTTNLGTGTGNYPLQVNGGSLTVTTSYDGFTLLGSANITGRIDIYGMSNS
jgi:hypothetical protein